MLPYADNHIHSSLCGHAIGSPEDYVKQALKTGLQEIGFSDHAPMVHKPMPHVTMSLKELPLYQAMIEDVQKQYATQISIKIALEADFMPGYENKTEAMTNSYPYDYIIGSVHFIDDWAFDDPAHREYWKNYNVDDVFRKYYALLRQSAQSGLYQIIGHCDLPKKFGARPSLDLSHEIKETARVFKDSGVAIEINTSGLRKPIAEIYPDLNSLKIYHDFGVPLVFGSDAHDPNDVGRDFETAVKWALSAGYKEYVIFKNKKIEKVLPLL
ncbi:MAG: histidinol-phosphatase HisJ [Candidatus Omnitrophica bacterium]|nr:histidinol-phosphatase HisJ [Candidatus Omnitrophota bacterium]